jgi:hypothetical protein
MDNWLPKKESMLISDSLPVKFGWSFKTATRRSAKSAILNMRISPWERLEETDG